MKRVSVTFLIAVAAITVGTMALAPTAQAAAPAGMTSLVGLELVALGQTPLDAAAPVIGRRCPPGMRWSVRWRRCVRFRLHRRCRPGWRWAPGWRRCVRWHARRCPAGWRWSPRWRRCIRHGWRHCGPGRVWSYRLRRCVGGRWRRCPPGWRYYQGWNRCVRW